MDRRPSTIALARAAGLVLAATALAHSAARSSQGWHPYEHPSGDREDPLLADGAHVHVDVGT